MCAFGTYLELCGDLGVGPWETLNRGIALHLPFTYGQVSVIVSLLVVVADLLLKERIGIGTILDAVLVGTIVDLFFLLDPVICGTLLMPRLLCLVTGMIIIFIGQYIYMSAGLCCGPRDALLVALGKRAKKLPVGAVQAMLFLAVFAVAALLGAPFGAGTLIVVLGGGPVMQLVFGLFHFDPRDVIHRDLVQSIADVHTALKKT